MTPKRLGPISTVQEYLETIWTTSAPGGSGIRIFRGQAEDKPLLPKLFRKGCDPAKLGEIEHWMLDQFRHRCLHLLPCIDCTPSHGFEEIQFAGSQCRQKRRLILDGAIDDFVNERQLELLAV